MLYIEFFSELGLRNLTEGHLGRHLINSPLGGARCQNIGHL